MSVTHAKLFHSEEEITMQHCGNSYGVFNGATWIWFRNYQQACDAEREVWAAKVRAKLKAGGKVILTPQMAEALGLSATSGTVHPASGKANN